MAQRFYALTLAVVGLAIACLSVVTAAQTQGKKPNTIVPVPLIVEVDPGTTLNPMRIVGDGAAYEDGDPGVAAKLDQYGNLIINLGPLRTFCYDYGSPAGTQQTPPSAGPTCPGNTYMATSGLGQGLTKKFQELGPGESQCIRGEPTYRLPDAKETLFRHLFQRSVNGIPAADTGSAYLLATRTDDGVTSPRTWTVESAPAVNPSCDSSNSGIARVVSSPTLGKYALTDWGRYSMPMKLTLTEK